MTLVKSIQYNVLMHNDDNPLLNRDIDHKCTNVAPFFLTRPHCLLTIIQYGKLQGYLQKEGKQYSITWLYFGCLLFTCPEYCFPRACLNNTSSLGTC